MRIRLCGPWPRVPGIGSFLPVLLILLLAGGARAGSLPPIQTVFIILMENQDWVSIQGSAAAPYINHTLLPMGSHCSQYFSASNPLHPSEPNYIWLEAGSNLGITDNNGPLVNHQNTTNHLVSLLQNAGISWKTYQEDIDGLEVPLTATNLYVPRHNAFVYFDDVTGTNDPSNPYGIAHIRPYTELAQDLASNTVARYNFITPNLCDDMHDPCPPLYDLIRQGDNWLASEIPKLLASPAYTNGGAIFITWDEPGPNPFSDGAVGMIVLSPFVKGGGYVSNVPLTHSSTLRTFQEIFGVKPLLGDAANVTNLSDLFLPVGMACSQEAPAGVIHLTVSGVLPGTRNVVQSSTNMVDWTSISTNVARTNFFIVRDLVDTNSNRRFYRVVQLP